MTIKIVLPVGNTTKCGFGTKVFTESGHEIEGVESIDIRISPNETITATMRVLVSSLENLEGVEGVVIIKEPAEDDQ